MEYQFSFDHLNRPLAQCSMDHEAFGDWLTEDMPQAHTELRQLLEKIRALLAGRCDQYRFISDQYQLTLTPEDAILRSKSYHQQDTSGSGDLWSTEQAGLLHDDDDQWAIETDELSLDDQYGHAMCGLEDFQALLEAWHTFITDNG
jgi:uncharacterized protein YacL (UPF0231 family)